MAMIAALAALLGYGGWSAWLNSEAGHPSWWLPGLTQGSYAAVQTLAIHGLVTVCYRWLRIRARHPFVLTLLAVGLASVLVPLAIQLAVGNRRTVASLLPGAVIGHVYIYALLRRLAGAPTAACEPQRCSGADSP